MPTGQSEGASSSKVDTPSKIVSPREALAGREREVGPRIAAKEKADDLGHRVRTGGMTEEDMATFFKENPQRALELAKIATEFQGAAEKISVAPAKKSNGSGKRNRMEVGDIVDADADITIDDTAAPRRRGKRSSGAAATDEPRRTSTGRRVDPDANIFAESFPLERSPAPKCLPFGASILVAAVMFDGPLQQEERDDADRHRLVVKSAIANSFGESAVTEFEAHELDPDTTNAVTQALIREFCLARVESSRVIMLATLKRVKEWLNMNIFGVGGPHPRALGTKCM